MTQREIPAARRGVYPADRASALAGVPRRTIYQWARSGVVTPSVSSRKLKLWSWADLVALRAVYWLRHPRPGEERRPTTMRYVRSLVDKVEQEATRLGDALASRALILRVNAAGVPYIEIGERLVEATHDWTQLAVRGLVIDLLTSFTVGHDIRGPDLLHPRDGVRIIPGKLAGEPHIEGTRIQTKVLWTLSRRGYTPEQLLKLYPDVPRPSLLNALDLERQLAQNIAAA